jgi:hypothetical protein
MATIKPNCWGFLKLEAVKKLIELLRRQGVFSLNGIKRAMRSFIASRPDLEDAQLGMQKASGLEVGEICREDMCRHGSLQLPIGDSVLSAEMMEVQHCKSCAVCGSVGRVACHCYFYKMLKCISNGWKPVIDESSIMPLYSVTGNYKSLYMYELSSEKEFNKMIVHGVVREVESREGMLVHPIGAVIKNSDKRKAKCYAVF